MRGKFRSLLGLALILITRTDTFAAPPVLLDAYPLSGSALVAVFDRSVTPASATNLTNYSLASFGSVNSAVMLTSSTVQLTITNGLSSGELETVTASGVVSVEDGQVMPL